MLSTWHGIVAIIAVSAFCRTAVAEQGDSKKSPSVEDLTACLGACLAEIKPDTSRSELLVICEKIPACESVGLKAPPPKTPSECTDLVPSPPRTPKKDERCAGVMIEVVDKVNSDCKITKSHEECKTVADVWQTIADIHERLTALSKGDDKNAEELAKIKAQLEKLVTAKGLPRLVRTILAEDLGYLSRLPEKLKDTFDEHRTDLDDQHKRLETHDRRLTDIERRVGSKLGIQVNAVGNMHALLPYDQTIRAVGGEIEVLPSFTERWRALLAVGVGYAGENDDGQGMTATWLRFGAQPQLNDWMHLAFGVVGERRFTEWDTAQFVSYGGFVEPKFCPGKNGHRICAGVLLAAEATTFDGPTHRQIFTRADGSVGLSLGYAFLP